MVTMVFNPATGEHRSSPVTGTRSLSSGAGQRARELTVLGKLGVAINQVAINQAECRRSGGRRLIAPPGPGCRSRSGSGRKALMIEIICC